MEKGLLELIEIGSKIFSRIAIPIIVLILGFCLNNSYSDREIRQKYIEISVGILNDKPTPETLPLREWAIKTLNSYSEKKLSPTAREILKTYPLHPAQQSENKIEEKKDIDKSKP